jgi:hypothetical protein
MSAKPQGTLWLIRRTREDQVKNWERSSIPTVEWRLRNGSQSEIFCALTDNSRGAHRGREPHRGVFAITGLTAMTKIKAPAPLSIKNSRIPLN